jgi:hypothetical protein
VLGKGLLALQQADTLTKTLHMHAGSSENVFRFYCYVGCPSLPCISSYPLYTKGAVLAGGSALNTYTEAGQTKSFQVVGKCACTLCSGTGCETGFWCAKSSNCETPVIRPMLGESFPSALFSRVCRSDSSDGSDPYNHVAGFESSRSSQCTAMGNPYASFSVLCAASGTC